MILQNNTSGFFQFKEPYRSAINTSQRLKVTSIRSIDEMIDGQIDVFKHVYDIVHINQDVMDDDRRNGISIVCFVTDSGKYIYVPENQIIVSPDLSGISYQERLLGIKLGALPIDLDISGLKSDIIELVKGRIGVEVSVKEVGSSAITNINREEDTILKQKRETVMSTSGTYADEGLMGSFFIAYLREKETIKKLYDQIERLKCAVKKLKN